MGQMPEWMTISEAAAYLKVDRKTIYRWCDAGRLKFYALESGSGRRFRREDLDRLLAPGGRWQELVDRSVAAATALGHEMRQEIGDGVNSAVYSCSRCGLGFVVGYPETGGPLEVTSAPVLTTPCPARSG